MLPDFDLEIGILQYLKEKGEEANFTEIVEALRNQLNIAKDSDVGRSLRIRVHKKLQSLKNSKILYLNKKSHKDACYGIKDHAHVAYVLSAYAQGLKVMEKPTPYKTDVTLSSNDFEELANKFAKTLLGIAFGERPVLQPFAPLVIRCREPLKDRLLMILPDQDSAQTLRNFREKEFEDLARFLTMAFGMYIQGPGRTSFNDIVIIKFTEKQLEILKRDGQSLDEIVYAAALAYMGKASLLPRIEDLPATREAIEKRIFANMEDAFRSYILKGEEDRAKKLLKGIE